MSHRILIVDDDPVIRMLLSRLLEAEYDLDTAADGLEALRKAMAFRPELVLLDIVMPGVDGYQICQRLKAGVPDGSRGRDVQVLMLSGKSSREERARAFEVGADDYLVKPFDPHELLSRVSLHFRLREAQNCVNQIRGEIDSHNSEIRLLAEQRMQEIIATQDLAVFTLAKLAECRDVATGGHLLRIRSYCQSLAEQLSVEEFYADQIDQCFLDDLYRSSPLHDIGKVGISDAILLKPGRLTAAEFATMETHTVIGANLLDQAVLGSRSGGFLAMAAIIARFHHERFDGSGYPAGLFGTEIPLPARIVAVADVYDALTSERPYKKAMPSAEARELILSESGKHFDPAIVDAFRKRYPEFLAIQRQHSEALPTAVGAMSFRADDFAICAN